MGDVLDKHMKNATIQYSSRAELVKEILRKHFNNNNGGNGAFSTTTSDPISPPTQKTEKKDQT